MGHKANKSFFDVKREWSKRKDLILRYYLEPYLAKVSKLRHPILIVDGFAGPSIYGAPREDRDGSPLIISKRVAAVKSPRVPIGVLCIEEDPELYATLAESLRPYEFARARLGTFLDHLPEVEERAATHTVFLYVDPYAIEGLQWEAMDRVFRHLLKGRSVEVLMNFNAASFVRRARAALAMAAPDEEEDEPEGSAEPPSIQRLNDAVGGDWWQSIVKPGAVFPVEVKAISDGFCRRLGERFPEVCQHPIHAKWTDPVPKYSLVFGSRSEDGLVLMNEAAIKSRDVLADAAKPAYPTLWETRPTELVPDLERLPQAVLTVATRRMRRRHLVAAVVRANFCQFTESQIKQTIRKLLGQGRLVSETGKPRINDDDEVWRP